MKIYCASDLHIGYEHTYYPVVIELFEEVRKNADRLILCGDVLDLWRCPIEDIQKKNETKEVFEALLSTTEKKETTYVWGNHDYMVEKMLKKNNIEIKAKISDDFVLDNIYFCHGWRFDVQQRFAHFLYGWLVTRFPYLYQVFFKTPFALKEEEEKYASLSENIHDEAREFIKRKEIDYLVMGHTHDPLEDGKLIDCGDMVDSLSYVIIEDGQPRIERISREG
ncbi:MAG: metallophosphoesterase family protein [Thermoplasmata archaeon]|nr:MAG: metallophosphoesterase family protein [Thermoplasmata archaeon]